MEITSALSYRSTTSNIDAAEIFISHFHAVFFWFGWKQVIVKSFVSEWQISLRL